LNLAAIASQQRVGLYLHIFPYANQVRRAIWRGMDKSTGVRYVDQAFPAELRSNTRDGIMEIEFHNGSIWNCVGSDNLDALRGANPVGVTLSEYAFCNPDAWKVISPIIRENGGWAAFVTTPFGKNHAWTMYQAVKDNPEWHVEYLTVEDTQRQDGSPIITPEMIDAERRDGMDEPTIQQEYYCRWDAPAPGAYFQKGLEAMRQQRRLMALDLDLQRRIVVAWRLSESDRLVAVAFQQHGSAHHCVASRAWDFTSYAEALNDLRECFTWNQCQVTHLIPHDGAAAAAFRAADVDPQFVVAPSPAAGVTLIREIMPTTWIDTANRPWAPHGNNADLVDALAGYRVADVDQGMLAGKPLRSWEAAWCEALALYAAGHGSGVARSDAWGPAPSYSTADRAVI
jgi:phage terminase large subunit